MNAREFTDHLAKMLRAERGAMSDFLLALTDFDRQELWRELGHTSLFYFLHRELKLSGGAAQNRKTATELIQQFPEVETAVRDGRLCLSTVNELAKVLTPENRDVVLPRFFGLSRREAEVVVASIRPAKVIPVRDVVTPLRPTPATLVTVDGEPAELRDIAVAPSGIENALHLDEAATAFRPVDTTDAFHLDETRNAAVTRPETVPSTQAPTVVPASLALPAASERVVPLDAERSRLSITVSRRFLDKLEAARDALSHAIPDGRAQQVLERGLDLVLAQHARRKGLVEHPRKAPRPSASGAIPAHVKRAVWRRAGGRCEWRFESGARCDCTRRLEFDHVQPEALGGEPTVENIRLLCRPHNVLAARRVFGDVVMDRYTRRRRRGPASAARRIAGASPGRAEPSVPQPPPAQERPPPE